MCDRQPIYLSQVFSYQHSFHSISDGEVNGSSTRRIVLSFFLHREKKKSHAQLQQLSRVPHTIIDNTETFSFNSQRTTTHILLIYIIQKRKKTTEKNKKQFVTYHPPFCPLLLLLLLQNKNGSRCRSTVIRSYPPYLPACL